ncbi:MAG TPA: hypothetical protein VGQ59_02985, partial [Cyclobacteriaceae bacterium]|nr:hypothetical protein [Cyclobacteriaceae bacterium]
MKFKNIIVRFFSGIVLVVVTLTSFNLAAQITQPIVYERSHKDSDHSFLVISMGDKGLALIRDSEKFEGNKKIWEAILLDSTLNESWSTKFEIDQRMNILGHDYRDGNVYLIFEEPENIARQINLTELILSERIVKQHKFKPDVNIQYTHFSILKNKAVFGGYMMKEPTLLMYDLTNESTKVIPGTFLMKEELMDVRNNSNDTFNALLIERDSKSIKKLIVRTYDSNGVLLVDDVIAIDEDKTIIEAISSALVRDELVVMGTWTYGGSKQAAGIFSVMVDPFNEQKVNYYDFAEFNHFLDYLKPKKAAKVKAKADWRKSVGKQPEFRAHLYPIKIEEGKEGFTLLGEVYDPPTNSSFRSSQYGYYPYNYNNYNPYMYSPYGFTPYRYNSPYSYSYPYNSSSTANDTRMLHSSLIFFDDHGKLVSDLSLKFPEIKRATKEQVSDFLTLGTRTVMVCKQEKEIITQINESDGSVIQTEKIEPALKNQNETAKSE